LDLDELVREAISASADAFIELIRNVASAMARESGKLGNLEVVGRLVKLPPAGQAIVIGDIHGDLNSLYHILRESRFLERAERGEKVYVVFLGDYADRGEKGPEVYYVVLKLKEFFPEHVVLLRGNHEGPADILAMPHDLPYHLLAKFGREGGYEAYKALRELWDSLHTAALVEGRLVMLHGGVPSKARDLEDLAFAHERHPEEPHLEEILWSDPEEGITGTYPSWRGAGRAFGPDVTRRFLLAVNARALVRGHEPCDFGYRLNHGGLIMTIFSRKGPPYYNRLAAYLELDLSAEVASARDLEPYVKTF